jgi:signal transduction histidine kinase
MRDAEIAKLTEELSACYEELALLHDLTDRLRPFDDVDRVAQTVLDALVEALGVRRAFILLVKDTALVHFRSAVAGAPRGFAVGGPASGLEAAIEDGITREAIATGVALYVNDVAADPRFRPYPFPITSLLCVPLKGRSPAGDHALGVLNVADRQDGQGFTSGDLKLVATVAGLAGAALENALLVRDLQQANRHILEQQDAMIRSEKLSSLGRMAAGVAHELRNPLAVISGRAQILQTIARGDRPPTPEQIDRNLAAVEEQAQRAVRIITGLSTYARQRPPELGVVALAEVVKETLELVQPQVKMDGLEVVTDIEPGLPAIHGNLDQLQQVFINLFVNAAQAMAGGGRLAVAAREDGGSVVVTVADTGSGIAPEHLAKIFDPFFTTKPEGEGTGLGLSIIQGIVETHGGRIGVTSTVGEGTTFTLQFPALPGGGA